MAGTTSINVNQNLKDAFSYKGMKELMAYLGTHNCESQTVAIDATSSDIQTTGTKMAIFNATIIVMTTMLALSPQHGVRPGAACRFCKRRNRADTQ